MFEIKGDKAQWQTVYDHLVTMNVGDVLTVEQLDELVPDAGSPRSAFHRAVREMETQRHRSFDTVRGVGYRMVDAPEHERLARDQHRKSRRSLARSHRKLTSADRTRLDVEQRRRMDALEVNVSAQRQMIKRLDSRVAKVEADVRVTRRSQAEDAALLAERIDKLTDTLRRHGIAIADEATANAAS